jgi:hypothetical protein
MLCRRASQNRYRADFGKFAGILMVPVLGRHTVAAMKSVAALATIETL